MYKYYTYYIDYTLNYKRENEIQANMKKSQSQVKKLPSNRIRSYLVKIYENNGES